MWKYRLIHNYDYMYSTSYYYPPCVGQWYKSSEGEDKECICLWTETLFTRNEMAASLLYKSKKSQKTGLDPVRVEKLFGKSI